MTQEQQPARLFTLGRLEIEGLSRADADLILRGRKRVALLVYLAAAGPGRFEQRDTILPLLWPELDQTRGRHALRNTLHGLRKVLGRDSVINRGQEEIALSPGAVAMDTTLFDTAYDEGRHEEAVTLYSGDFLEGFHVRGVSPALEHWIDRERERLARRYRIALERVATTHSDEARPAEATRAWRELTLQDPLNSEFVLRLMTELASSGDVGSALRAAKTNEEQLRLEYETAQDPAVAEFAERLRAEPFRRPEPESQGNSVHKPATNQHDDSLAARRVAPAPPAPGGPTTAAPAGQRPPRRGWSLKRGAWLGTLVLAGIALVMMLNATTRQGAIADPGTDPSSASLAVLPFVNLDADPEQEYLSDGIAEELLNLLSQVPDLRVVARTSAFAFKHGPLTLEQIADTLRVTHVVTGSVRSSGDRVRIRAALVDARSDTQLWSELYDLELADIFATQEEIAAAVVRGLETALPGFQTPSLPSSSTAYRLYSQARHLLRSAAGGHVQAEPLLEQALAIEPDYVEAWLALARVHWAFAIRGEGERVQLTRDAVDRALALDPDNGVAYGWAGWLAMYVDRDLEAAARNYERAVDLDPKHPDLGWGLMRMAQTFGLFDEGIELGEYYVDQDPVCLWCYVYLADTYAWAGKLVEADQRYQSALALAVGDEVEIRFLRGMLVLRMGDPEQAIEIFEQTTPVQNSHGRSLAYLELGQSVESEAALSELAAMGIPPSIPFLAKSGRMTEAFAALEERLQVGEFPSMTYFPTFGRRPLYEPLHSDARWEPLLRRHGLAPDQLERVNFKLPVSKITGRW